MKTILRYSLAALAIAGLMTASPALAAKVASSPARLVVEDNGELFSRDAIVKAKDTIAGSVGEGNREVHLETFKALTDSQQTELKAAGNDTKEFWKKWSKDKAKGDRGILILVNRSPGHVQVLADSQMQKMGFSSEKAQKIREMLLGSFRDAKKAKDDGKSDADQLAIRDAGLLSAIDYIKAELPYTTLVETKTNQPAKKEAAKKEGSNIWSYVCIGLAVLLGIWLVVGLIRAFTNRGGSGGGGPGGGGGGYGGGGGGGGGFMSGMLGGLFGGMAGMWMYNNMFGGHSESSAWGGDNSNSVGDSGSTTEAGGAGDFSDGGTGGDFDGGSSGGDTGGGGDWGSGGGDTGGGGGDWGGGGGDF